MANGSNGDGGSSWTPANVVMVLSAVSGLIVGIINAVQIRDVDDRQTYQVQKSEVHDQKLDAIEETTKKTEKVATKTASTVQDTLGPQLWSTWKYLEGIAEREDATAEDKAKVAEAKLAYERHLKK